MRLGLRSRGGSGRLFGLTGNLGLSLHTRNELPIFDLGKLALLPSEIIQLGPTHLALTHDLDARDNRRMEGEYSFHADTVGDFAHRKGLRVQQSFTSDHRTFEHLNALFFPFYHFHVHSDGVSNFKTRHRLLPEGLL